MPKLLSENLQSHFIKRFSEYINEAGIERCSVIFHGGEPMLAGASILSKFADRIRASTSAEIDVSIQTNGLLLNDANLDILEAADIGISLSLDGPRYANDKHRLTRGGKSSFTQVENALILLLKRPKIFTGVICVIDATTPPEDLFHYFAEFDIPQLDFLLPDAHHLNPPPKRSENPKIYEKWLMKAFDIWLDDYSNLPIRTFESLLDMLAGLPSRTDAFGFGDISLLSIETDGSYHDLDVLKVTEQGATKLFGSVVDTSISEVLKSEQITAHRNYLNKNGLSEKCKNCSIVDVCGGGSLPHRFDENGFKNPTVYCGEIFALVSHISQRLKEHLSQNNTITPLSNLKFDDVDFENFEFAEKSTDLIDILSKESGEVAYNSFLSILDKYNNSKEQHLYNKLKELPAHKLRRLAMHPGAIAWAQVCKAQNQGKSVYSVDGNSIKADAEYIDYLIENVPDNIDRFSLSEQDPWLRIPFGNAIFFDDETTIGCSGKSLVFEALEIIRKWRPALLSEMIKTSRVIQFVQDPSADPHKIVSFSDNSVPGALYVSVVQGEKFIDPYDLADSLIHEHRHQKLYLLEQQFPMVNPTSILVESPWREDLRPPSGLLHAVFVFVELYRFWLYVFNHGPERFHKRALNQIQDTEKNLKQSFITLKKCPLTSDGERLVEVLNNSIKDSLVYG